MKNGNGKAHDAPTDETAKRRALLDNALLEHGTRHYNDALDDADYFRTKFAALRKDLAHAVPDAPLASLPFGAENKKAGTFLDEFAEHLARAVRNPWYHDNGELADLVFLWYITAPMVCDYLERRDVPEKQLEKLTRCAAFDETAVPAEELRDALRETLDADMKANARTAAGGYTQADRKRDEQTKNYARQAAANRKRELEGKAHGGKKGAATRKAEKETDPLKEAMMREVRKMMKDWDERYPDRGKKGNKNHSNNQIYAIVAKRHKTNGEPIYTSAQIKWWFNPSAKHRNKCKN